MPTINFDGLAKKRASSEINYDLLPHQNSIKPCNEFSNNSTETLRPLFGAQEQKIDQTYRSREEVLPRRDLHGPYGASIDRITGIRLNHIQPGL